MTKLRGFIPTTLMLITLMFGATAANAGIIITNRAAKEESCKTTESSIAEFFKSVSRFAITGIIITNRAETQETCGIIITN